MQFINLENLLNYWHCFLFWRFRAEATMRASTGPSESPASTSNQGLAGSRRACGGEGGHSAPSSWERGPPGFEVSSRTSGLVTTHLEHRSDHPSRWEWTKFFTKCVSSLSTRQMSGVSCADGGGTGFCPSPQPQGRSLQRHIPFSSITRKVDFPLS